MNLFIFWNKFFCNILENAPLYLHFFNKRNLLAMSSNSGTFTLCISRHMKLTVTDQFRMSTACNKSLPNEDYIPNLLKNDQGPSPVKTKWQLKESQLFFPLLVLQWRCFLMAVEPCTSSIPTAAIFSQDTGPVLLGLWPHPGPDVARGYCRDGWAIGMAETLPLDVLTASEATPPPYVSLGQERKWNRGEEGWRVRKRGWLCWNRWWVWAALRLRLSAASAWFMLLEFIIHSLIYIKVCIHFYKVVSGDIGNPFCNFSLFIVFSLSGFYRRDLWCSAVDVMSLIIDQ